MQTLIAKQTLFMVDAEDEINSIFTAGKKYPVIDMGYEPGDVVVRDDNGDKHQLGGDYLKNYFEFISDNKKALFTREEVFNAIKSYGEFLNKRYEPLTPVIAPLKEWFENNFPE